jgi:hypothetical protein
MPTLPTQSLFDKDLSLRSPFPHHVLAPTPQRPPVAFAPPAAAAANATTVHAPPRDFSQIRRPTPIKAKAHSVFDLSFGPNGKSSSSSSSTSTFRPPVTHQSLLRDADRADNATTLASISSKEYRSNTSCKPNAKSKSKIKITLLTL